MKTTFKQAFQEESETFFQATTTNHFPIMKGREWLKEWGNDPDLEQECDLRATDIYNDEGTLVYHGVDVRC